MLKKTKKPINIPPKKVGAPIKYKPEFCEKVIEMGKYGASKVEMACELNISRAAFDDYEDKYPEFLQSVNQAIAFSQAWWEKQGRLATFGQTPNFNATSFIFNMKNRFKDDWRDKVEQEHTGKDGKDLNPSLNDDDRELLKRFVAQTGEK